MTRAKRASRARPDPQGRPRAGRRGSVLPVWLAAVVVLAAIVAVTVAVPAHPARTGAAGVSVLARPADDASLGCAGLDDEQASSTLVAATPDLGSAAATVAGKVTATPISSGAAALGLDLDRADAAAAVAVPRGGTPVLVDATGTLAHGTQAVVTSTATTGPARGAAVARCAVPRADWWFSGLSGSTDRRDVLLLANPGDSPVNVALTAYGPSGALTPRGGSTLVVAPHGSQQLFAAAQFPRTPDLSVHVQAGGGGLIAQTRSYAVTGGFTAAGADWIAPAAPPAERVLLPAVPGGSGGSTARTVSVVNPSELDTTVRVTVYGPQGSFTPPGSAAVSVPAGAERTLRLPALASGDADVTVGVTADQPVTASLRTTSRTGQEFTTTAATEAASGVLGAAVPVHTGSLMLTIGAGTAAAPSVAVETLGADGDVTARRTVAVPTGSTAQVPIPASRTPGSIRVTSSVPVVAGLVLAVDASGTATTATPEQLASWPLAPPGATRAPVRVTDDPGTLFR